MIAAWGRLVARRPRVVVAGICLVALVVGSGMARTEQAPDLVEALIPDRTDLADALERIDERFPESERTTTAQIIVRGAAVDPNVVSALDSAVVGIVTDPVVAPYVAGVVVHSELIAALTGTSPADLEAADIDAALAAAGATGAGAEAQRLDDLLVRGPSGSVEAAVGWIELRRGVGSADDVLAAERRIGERLAAADLGPASARALTNAAFEDATADAMDDSLVLFPVAVVLLVAVLYFGYRSASDVVATFAGMILVTVFTLGAEGWLGPAGFGVLGGATAIGVVIPVLLIGLTVDYALQVTSAYRDAMANRARPPEAAASAVATSGRAVALGAGTTALSFSTNVASPLGPIRDFGVLAAIGIVAGLVIMTGLVPAWRVVVDPRRGQHNRALRRGALLSELRGVAPLLRGFATLAARRPLAVVSVAAGLGVAGLIAAAGIDVRFETEDFLPADSDFIADVDFLEDEAGGADSTVTAVIVGDRGDPQVAGSIADLEGALAAGSRPAWIAGEVRVLVDPAAGDDTTLVTVPVRLGDTDERRAAMDWFEDQWRVEDGRLTLVGELVLPIVVADAVARGQMVATAIALVAALAVLTGYFSRVHQRALLGPIVVAPIVLVLVLVLGSMRLLGIPYNALTATLTALTIGIGVDYTIHVVHHYLEEHSRGSPPPVALLRVAGTTGGALVVSAATTMVGFGVLMAAPLPAVGQLGVLTALTVALSLMVAVIVLPALLVLAERARARRASAADRVDHDEPPQTRRSGRFTVDV